MTSSKPLRILITLITVVGWTLPTNVRGDQDIVTPASRTPETVTQAAAPIDVSISATGHVRGMAVDEAGQALSGMRIYLLHQEGMVVAQTVTDNEGQFTLPVGQGGVYQIVADGSLLLLRCWASETAPPRAQESFLVSVGSVQRGQIHPAMCGLANPWVITGIVVAAIAIPVAINNNRSDRDPASP